MEGTTVSGTRGKPRQFVGVRLDPDGLAALDQRAMAEGLTAARTNAEGEFVVEAQRSEMIRLLLAFGLARMPKGWRPKGWEPSS